MTIHTSIPYQDLSEYGRRNICRRRLYRLITQAELGLVIACSELEQRTSDWGARRMQLWRRIWLTAVSNWMGLQFEISELCYKSIFFFFYDEQPKDNVLELVGSKERHIYAKSEGDVKVYMH